MILSIMFKSKNMEKYKILSFVILLSLWGFLSTGCDDNMPVVREVGVEGLTLNETLVNGFSLHVDETAEIAGMVALTPADATDRAENFSTSDPEVATISPYGVLTGNGEGTCEVTISVGGKSATFVLTVLPKIIIPIESISLTITSLEMKMRESYDLASQVVVSPIAANEQIVYTSSDPAVLTIDAAGQIIAVSAGTATITVASESDPTINATLNVVVSSHVDHVRTGWTMTTSHMLPLTAGNPEGNSLSAALDGDLNTNLSMVRPNKEWGLAPNRLKVEANEAIYFIVDMQESKKVDYFRIRHRNTKSSEMVVRWRGFDQILGSNNGVDFEVITNYIAIPNVEEMGRIESPDIIIPNSTYRYLKFYAKENKCFNGNSNTSGGSTVQIQELYIGEILE